jgi:hypothetical protein
MCILRRVAVEWLPLRAAQASAHPLAATDQIDAEAAAIAVAEEHTTAGRLRGINRGPAARRDPR